MVHAVDEFIGSIGGFFVVGLRLFAQTLQGWVPIPWPLTILAFAPLAFVVLSIVVWFLRGTSWPVRCAYPTTRSQPCKRVVPGEWFRCHDHRHPWTRKTDSHRVDPRLYRWQTSVRGVVKDRDDIEGRGFLRLASNRAGVLFYHGFARPPRNIYWQPLVDWWRKLFRVARRLAARQSLRVATGVTRSESGVFDALDSVIQANVQLATASVLWSTLASYEVQQNVTPNGGREVLVPFVVHVNAYLT